ncbi:MAG: hypothetical protein ACTSWJ_03310 [Candidatus Heimdallarchaeaceae archaeon]
MTSLDKCPECGTKGQKVANFTVQRIVKKQFKEIISSNDFHLCKDAICETGYFNNEIGKTIHRSDLKKPLWYKEGADPKLACYCTNITEDDIIKTVIETGLKSMRHIMFYLSGRLGNTCKYRNPQGICCEDIFNSMITKARRIKQNINIQSELNPSLLQEIQSRLSLKEDSILIDVEKLNKELLEKEPTSRCGCSSEE